MFPTLQYSTKMNIPLKYQLLLILFATITTPFIVAAYVTIGSRWWRKYRDRRRGWSIVFRNGMKLRRTRRLILIAVS